MANDGYEIACIFIWCFGGVALLPPVLVWMVDGHLPPLMGALLIGLFVFVVATATLITWRRKVEK